MSRLYLDATDFLLLDDSPDTDYLLLDDDESEFGDSGGMIVYYAKRHRKKPEA